MSDTIEPLDLDEAKRLCDAATPGPWFYNSYSAVFSEPKLKGHDEWLDRLVELDGHTLERYGRCDACGDAWPIPTGRSPQLGAGCRHAAEAYDRDPLVASVPASAGDSAHGMRAADAEFIAAARSAIPALLDELGQTRAQIEQVRKLHHGPRTERYGSGCIQCGICWPCPTALALGWTDGRYPNMVDLTEEGMTK